MLALCTFVAGPAAGQTSTNPPHDIGACGGHINCLHCHALYDDNEPNLPRFAAQQDMCQGACHYAGGRAGTRFDNTTDCNPIDTEPLWKVANHQVTAHLTGLRQTADDPMVLAPNARFEQMDLRAGDVLTIDSGPNADTAYVVDTVLSETALLLQSAPASDGSPAGDAFSIPQELDCGTCHTPHGIRSGTNLRLLRADSTIGKYVPNLTPIVPVVVDIAPVDGEPDYFAAASAPYDGICNVCHSQTAYHRCDASGDHGHEIDRGPCTACHPHNRGFAAIGGNCAECHMDDGDVDDYDHTNGTTSIIDETEWLTHGHGKPSVGFDGDDTCIYCHNEQAAGGAAHDEPSNPFRLVNKDQVSGRGWNSVCLVCHGVGSGGYNGKNASTKIESRHFGAAHGTGNDGGSLCWDCHDPHGDDDNVQMIARRPRVDKTDAIGWVATYAAVDVVFTSNASGSDFGSTAANAPRICNVCHTTTLFYRATEATSDHNNVEVCTAVCHLHNKPTYDDGFLAAESKCSDCHVDAITHSDSDNWDIDDGVATKLSDTEYASVGHGQYGWADGGCLHCHIDDQGANPAHEAAGNVLNPFLLTNENWNGEAYNGTCGICHSPSRTGFDPVGSNPAAYAASTGISSDHHGGDHDATHDGGKLCWDCHDPHGDGSNIKMIGTQLTLDNGDDWGLSALRTDPGIPVVFTASGAGSDFASNDASPDAVCNVCHTVASHYQATGGDGHLMAGLCTDCHPHEQTEGGTDGFVPVDVPCADCHAGPSDVDSWDISDGTISVISIDEWTSYGHGNPAWPPGQRFAGSNNCLYCHEADSAVPHELATNPFKLANVSSAQNDNCVICHDGDASGYAPPGHSEVNGTTVMTSAHDPATRVGPNGGARCWDCHDPHGDAVAGVGNIDMIGSTMTRDSYDAYGLAGARTTTTVFTADAAGSDFVTATGDEGVCNVCHTTAAHYTDSGGDDHLIAAVCTGCHRHENAGPDGFAPLDAACSDCHVGAADVDSWDISDGTISKISSTEWSAYGHGNPVLVPSLGGPNNCLYCHEPDSEVPHEDATNPFKLANYDVLLGGWNDNCIVCHDDDGSGYAPDGSHPEVNGATVMVSYHAPSGRTPNGGALCWDCHDPHGDDIDGPGGTPGNVEMIGTQLTMSSHDAYGLTGTRTGPTVLVSTATGSDYADATSPYEGVCNVCHTTTSYYTSSSGSSHYQGESCTTGTCHNHDQTPDAAFGQAGGGACLTCHTDAAGSYRAVAVDFGLQSHHAGTGLGHDGTPGTTVMGGTLTDFDCVVCHAEGSENGIETATTGYHRDTDCHGGAACIDLYDADALTTVYRYDRGLIRSTAGTTPGNWHSGDANWRDEQALHMDPFCLSCHDSDGATASAAGDGGTAGNPFNDGAVANEYDQRNRGTVIDVAIQVVCDDATLPPVGTRCASYPAGAAYSIHPIRGQSTSRYQSTAIPAAAWNTTHTSWDDTSVMGCADCHTTDGANGTAGNAHGSTSEYLLKDVNLLATEGVYVAGNPETQTYICYACHAGSFYTYKASHGQSSSDYAHTAGLLGTNRTTNDGSTFGMACSNCHGGTGYGTIHGTSEHFGLGEGGVGFSCASDADCDATVGAGGWCDIGGTDACRRNAYRFVNGGSLRYVDVLPWDGPSITCYTLGAADTWGGCKKHPRGDDRDRQFIRGLVY